MIISDIELKRYIINAFSSPQFYFHNLRFDINKEKYYIPDWDETVKPIIEIFIDTRQTYNKFHYNCLNFSRSLAALINNQNFDTSGNERPPIASAALDCFIFDDINHNYLSHALNLIILNNNEDKQIAIIEPQLITPDRSDGFSFLEESNIYYPFNIEFW